MRCVCVCWDVLERVVVWQVVCDVSVVACDVVMIERGVWCGDDRGA